MGDRWKDEINIFLKNIFQKKKKPIKSFLF